MTKKINLTTVGKFISVVKQQEIWQLDDLLKKVNINYDELLYLLTILSDIYSKNGDYFFDFDLDTENNKISFTNSTEIFDIETITDLELFKVYTLINTIDIELDIETITKKDIGLFNNILKAAFKVYDLKNENEINDKYINLNENTTIEYIKLGKTKSEFYEIEPLLITSNTEGSVLEALDLEDKKIKTFLINRIISIGHSVDKKSKLKNKENEIEVTFEMKDKRTFLNHKNIKSVEDMHIAKFRNKNIAIDFFIENFTSSNVISPDIVKVEVMKRVKSIRKLLTQ